MSNTTELHPLVEPHGDGVASRIVSAILRDVTDRRGWRHQWDQFDDELKAAIVARWIEIVREELLPP
jgi:hypothetical protein